MRIEPLSIADARRVRLEPYGDERGWFARVYCVHELGQDASAVQASLSFNRRAGTLRGLHFQWPPSREGKLVRCLRGRLIDVLLDLRPESPSYLRHEAVALDGSEREGVFVPPGVAHGFQTLEDATEVLYLMSDFYAPALQGAVRWDDPAFAIRWPLPEPLMSARDRTLPAFDRMAFERELRARRAAGPS